MPMYRVTMKRSFEETGTVLVEADDADDARDIAPQVIDEDGEWGSQSLEEECIESVELAHDDDSEPN
jgi:hypothetical protein